MYAMRVRVRVCVVLCYDDKQTARAHRCSAARRAPPASIFRPGRPVEPPIGLKLRARPLITARLLLQRNATVDRHTSVS